MQRLSRHRPIQPTTLRPPVVERRPSVTRIHGRALVDDYAWLKNRHNPAVLRHLQQENAYADYALGDVRALSRRLCREMRSRMVEEDVEPPYAFNGWLYYDRVLEDRQYAVHCRRREAADSPEQVVLDMNAVADGHNYCQLGTFEVSDDGNRLAYTVDFTGDRDFVLFVKDLRTGELRTHELRAVQSVAWAADGRVLFAVTADDARRPCRLLRLDAERGDPAVVWDECDRSFEMWVERSRSRAMLTLTIANADTSEVRWLDASRPNDDWRPIAAREKGVEYYAEHVPGGWLLRTNDAGGNFHLAWSPIEACSRGAWIDVVPHRDEVMLEDVTVFSRHAVLHEIHAGQQRLRVCTLAERGRAIDDSHVIEFDEPAYAVEADLNLDFHATTVRLIYQSLATPPMTIDYDMASGRKHIVKRHRVLGGYDPGDYTTVRRFATSDDGTRVPITLIYRTDLHVAAPQPLLLTAYGAYGAAALPEFCPTHISLLDRGFVYAIAHVRGGGEMGERWHEQGRLDRKSNTFADFNACARELIDAGYTSPQQLAAYGASAGGLTVAAAVNLDPDLYAAMVLDVPFVDVLNTMLDDSLPLTVLEYDEWGNPNEWPAFRTIRSYCPYQNLRPARYPATLVIASLHDSQVLYFEAAKFAAKLRAARVDDGPTLLRTNLSGGHGGASGRFDALQDEALIASFLLRELTDNKVDLGAASSALGTSA